MPLELCRSDLRFRRYRRWKRGLIFLVSLSLSHSYTRTSHSHADLSQATWDTSGFSLLVLVSSHFQEEMSGTSLTSITASWSRTLEVCIFRTNWDIDLKQSALRSARSSPSDQSISREILKYFVEEFVKIKRSTNLTIHQFNSLTIY